MSDLTAFRDHARAMSEAQHKPDCRYAWTTGIRAAKPPPCTGCVTVNERALWAQLADEVDAYLGSHDEEALPI